MAACEGPSLFLSLTSSSSPASPSASDQDEEEDGIVKIANIDVHNMKLAFVGKIQLISHIKKFIRKKRKRQVITIDVRDDSASIRILVFDEFIEQVQKFKVGDCIKFKHGQITKNVADWNPTKHRCLIYFIHSSEMTLLSNQRFSFELEPIPCKSIFEIKSTAFNQMVNLYAIIVSQMSPDYIFKREQNIRLFKKEILLIDDSSEAIILTLWNDAISKYQFPDQSVVRIVNAKVGSFNEKSLCLAGTMELVNDERAAYLRRWYQRQAKHTTLPSFVTLAANSSIYLSQITFDSLIKSRKFFYNCELMILSFEMPEFYRACPKCRKKLTYRQQRMFCMQCQLFQTKSLNKIMVRCLVGDPTKEMYLTLLEPILLSLLDSERINIESLTSDLEKLTNKSFIFSFKATAYLKNYVKCVYFNCLELVPI